MHMQHELQIEREANKIPSYRKKTGTGASIPANEDEAKR